MRCFLSAFVMEKSYQASAFSPARGIFFLGWITEVSFWLWQMLRDLVLYVVQPNPTTPVGRLNDSSSQILVRLCLCSSYQLWLTIHVISVCPGRESSRHLMMSFYTVMRIIAVLWLVLWGGYCSQWPASSVHRPVAGGSFHLEEPGGYIKGCVWLLCTGYGTNPMSHRLIHPHGWCQQMKCIFHITWQ